MSGARNDEGREFSRSRKQVKERATARNQIHNGFVIANRASDLPNDGCEEGPMFARWLVLTVKTGKKAETVKKVQQDILPILEKRSGFLGLIPLEPLDEPLKVYVMSLWDDRCDAENYERESFGAVTHILEPFLVLPPVVKHGTIDKTVPKTLVTAASV